MLYIVHKIRKNQTSRPERTVYCSFFIWPGCSAKTSVLLGAASGQSTGFCTQTKTVYAAALLRNGTHRRVRYITGTPADQTAQVSVYWYRFTMWSVGRYWPWLRKRSPCTASPEAPTASSYGELRATHF